jgi:glycosyltransferase involved in cell wall biosynthesis
MKILWITNVPVAKHCDITKTSPLSGGWMLASLEMLKGHQSIEICVVTTWPVKKKTIVKEQNIEYIVLPGGYPILYNYSKVSNHKEWDQIVSYFKPDIIHIHGTEFPLGLGLLTARPNEKYIISIQGLCSVIERYYYAGIDFSEIIKTITFRDLIRFDTIFQIRKKFHLRGSLEIKYLNRIRHVIGRTDWDRIHTKVINPSITYHFCNESLRSEFYQRKWDLNKTKRHSIFISQASYPIKGFHILLKALNILKLKYRDITIYIAGIDITRSKNFTEKISLSGYGKLLRKLINENLLHEYLVFTGNLNAEQMASYYQNSHVFVCPSSIENSPNSVGEAQLIGIPCVASYAGGIPDMIVNGETGLLYRFEEYEMLASNIDSIFSNDDLSIKISNNGRKIAQNRHNRMMNMERTIEIYNEIINS